MRRLIAAIALLLLSAAPVWCQVTVMPVPVQSFTNASGLACNGCLLETYGAGTDTPLATYQDAAASVPHANPVVLNSVGRPDTGTPIYLSPTTYKFILKTSAGSTIWTADNVLAVPATTTGVSNAADITFQVDSDNNGTNKFSFLNGTLIEKAQIDEDGDGQFDGNVTIGDATEADKAVLFDGNAQDFHVGIDDSVDSLIIGRGTALGTTPAIAVSSAGALTLTGAITAATGQLAFPATQNASADVNTLDDYEEGTWTPVIGGSGGTSGQTYTTQTGTYTKVGRQVTAHFNVVLSAEGTITTNAQIQGLPFTPVTIGNCTMTFWAAIGNYANVMAIWSSGAAVDIYGLTGGAASPVIFSATEITNTSRLQGVCFFSV